MSSGKLLVWTALALFGACPVPLHGQTVSIKNSIKEKAIDPAFNFNALNHNTNQNDKIIEFLISNTGGGAIVINSIRLVILDKHPYVYYTFPRGPLGKVLPNDYSVTLSASTNVINVTNDLFQLHQNESDAIRISLKSNDKLQYRFNVIASGFDLSDRKKAFELRSPNYQVTFPQMVDYADTIRNAKSSVDIFLNGSATSELVARLVDMLKSTNLKIRIITGPDFLYDERSFNHYILSVNIAGSPRYMTPAGLVQYAGYGKFRSLSNFAPPSPGFIIIDKKLVLTNETKFLLGKASVYRDRPHVDHFVGVFNSRWRTKPSLTAAQYSQSFGSVNGDEGLLSAARPVIHSLVGGTMPPDEFAHLLRYVPGEQTDATLSSLSRSPDPITRQEATDSIKYRKAPDQYDF